MFTRRPDLLYLPFLAALLILTLFAYWPGRTGGFVFDDYPNIVDNVALHVTRPDWQDWLRATLSSPARNLPRPLAMLSFAVNHYFTGLDPVPLKLTNIAIHLLNVLLVFGLIRAICNAVSASSPSTRPRSEWAALLVAACWALHPINVTAVLLVVQRMESLSHTFVFAGLWIYVAARSRQQHESGGWGRILAGVLVFSALGTAVKESAVLLPLFAFCLELFVFRFNTFARRDGTLLKTLFGFALFLPAAIGTAWLLSKALAPGAFGSRSFSLAERLMTESRVVFEYLRWIVLPDPASLSLYHDDFLVSRSLTAPPTTLWAIAGLVIMPILTWKLGQRRPLSGLGIAWFFGAQLLTATFLPLELVFEHRNYFASLGICLLAIDLLLFAPVTHAARRLGAALGIAAVVALGGMTFLRANEWSTPMAFAVSEAAKHPESPRASYYLGWMLSLASGFKADSKLIEPAFAAFERARRIPNGNILPDQGSLILAARTGRPLEREWWDHMRQRLLEHPVGPQETGALNGLVVCELARRCSFPPDEMLSVFAAALSHGPNAEVLSVYANYVLNVVGEPELAIRLWQEARALSPGEPEYRMSVIKLLIVMGRHDEAREEIAQLRRMGRLGQYAVSADRMEARLRAAMLPSPPTPPHH